VHSAVNNRIRGTRLDLFAIPRQGALGHVSVSRRLIYIYIYIYMRLAAVTSICDNCF
jgi:hypothetical protein